MNRNGEDVILFLKLKKKHHLKKLFALIFKYDSIEDTFLKENVCFVKFILFFNHYLAFLFFKFMFVKLIKIYHIINLVLRFNNFSIL